MENYLRAVDINPTIFHGYFNLGNAYMSMGRHSEAVYMYEQALRLNPDADFVYDALMKARATQK